MTTWSDVLRQYLSLPGTAGNYASTPDSAAVSVTGDIDIRVKVAMDDWTPATNDTLVAKYNDAGVASYLLDVNTNGTLRFVWRQGGASKARSSTAATGVANGATKWARATLDVDNGAAGHDVKFYTSDDGEAWTQLGATVTTAGVTSIDDTAESLRIGSRTDAGIELAGKVYYAEVRNGIDGDVVAKFDPNEGSGTSFTSSTGEVWTINQSGSPSAELTSNTWSSASSASTTWSSPSAASTTWSAA